jgi:hypothetical protein
VAQTAEIRVATGPWPDSVPPVQVDASSFSPPFTFIPIDLTLIEETLTVESGFPTITIIGEARNDSEEPAWLIPLTVAGLDADGELVDSAEISMMGGSSVTPRDFPPEWIIPGGTGWFTATLTDSADRPVETILIRAQGMIPNMKSGTAAPIEIAAGLEMAGDWQIEQDGWAVTLNGLVRNTGAGDVVGLRVATAFRDSEGALVELGGRGQRAEVIGGFLGGVPAGGEVPVDLWFYMDPEVLDTGTIDTRLSAFQLGDPEYVSAIVGIGHLQGLGGSTWRSSIDLVNRSGAAARVFLIYRHDGGETGAILDLDDAEAFHSEDVAVELFGIDDPSSGYVLVRSPVPLQIGGRTSNETAVGGYGQALPVVAPEMTYDFGSGEGPAGVLPSLRGGSSFRTNIGLVNFGAEACSAQVVIFGDDGQTLSDWGWVELERAEWRQVNRAIPTDVELAYATIEPEPGCPIWAYASVIEEGTGDPVTVAMERLVEIDLRPSEVHGMVGVIPWTNH